MDDEQRKRLIEILERAKVGRGQRAFAKDLGIQLNSLQQWLKGKSVPVIDKLPAIARSSGITTGDVLNYILWGEEGLERNNYVEPLVAEDVFNYGKPLSVEEKVRLIGMLVNEIAQKEKSPSDPKVD